MSSTAADERPSVRREAAREALIEATAQIMLDGGYAAATSRRVAAKAGVRSALVFTEFLAMANHRNAIRSEAVACAIRFRDLEEGVVTLALKARGIDLDLFPPIVMTIMGGLARMVLHEEGVGITRGHSEAIAFIERCLDRFEMPAWDQSDLGTERL
jgi:AcrR family transcriptional regulator